MSLLHKVQHFFLPTRQNVYRPALLGKTSLVFFLATTLAVEGFLVAGLVARQSDGTFLSQAPTSVNMQNAAAVSIGGKQFNMQTVANAALIAIVVLLVLGVGVAFFRHPDVQAHEMLAGGITVAAVALVCLLGNVYFLGAVHSQEAMVLQSIGG